MSVATENRALRFFTAEWAEAARNAVDLGPDEAERRTKLPTYWEWIDKAREAYSYSWTIGVRDLPSELGGPSHLYLRWQDGRCVEGSIITSDRLLKADYAFDASFDTWRGLISGEKDPQRLVMYRQLRLEEGDTLLFFRGVYFFVESVAAIGRVPTIF